MDARSGAEMDRTNGMFFILALQKPETRYKPTCMGYEQRAKNIFSITETGIVDLGAFWSVLFLAAV